MSRKTVGIGIILAFIIVMIGLFIMEQPNITQRYSVPKSFMAAAAFGTNSVVFSNSNELATYNYTTGVLRNLSHAVGLGTIDTVSVSPNDNYIVFHDSQVTQTGPLAAQLQANGLDTTQDYWWVYDIKDKTYHPLPQNILMAKVDNSHVYALMYSPDGSGETITTYKVNDLQSLRTISIPGSSNFFVMSNGFLLQRPNNTVLQTTNGVVNQQILSGAVLAGVNQDGKNAVAVVTQNGTRNLEAIDLDTGVVTVVTKRIINAPVWMSSGTALYATQTGKIYAYNSVTHKSTQWSLGSKLSALKPATLQLTALVGPKAAVVTDTSGNIYLIGSNLASTHAL